MTVPVSFGPDGLEERLLEICRRGHFSGSTVASMLEALAGSLEREGVALWMSDTSHDQTLICVSAWADTGARSFVASTKGVALPTGASAVGRCWTNGQSITIPDLADEDATVYRRDLLVEAGFRSALMAPLSTGGERIAVLELLSVHPGTDDHLDVVLTELVLSEIAGLVRGHLAATRAAMLQRRLALALEASGMGTWEWDRRTGHVAWSPALEEMYGFEPGAFPGTFESYDERIHPDDRPAMSESLQATLRSGGTHHVLHRIVPGDGSVRWVEGHGHPIRNTRGDVVGLTGVSVDVTDRERTLRELAHQIEVSEAALAEQRRVSNVLQHALLPAELPVVAGVDLASCYVPGAALVGGDFFHLIDVDDTLWLVLGDVCGKGPEAAAIAGLARHAIAGMVAAGLEEPDQILDRLNGLILDQDKGGRFVTLVLAAVQGDGERLRVRLCRAGHPLPVIRRSGGEATLAPLGPGQLLGCYRSVRLAPQEIDLDRGDSILFYTDGVTESRQGDDFFGEDRLVRIVADAPPSAQEQIDAVAEAFRRFDRRAEPDDVAMLVVSNPTGS